MGAARCSSSALKRLPLLSLLSSSAKQLCPHLASSPAPPTRRAVAAAAFFRSGQHEVADLHDAHNLLAPTLGSGAASTLFAVALLAAGQQSTITGTMAGQIVMEGFLGKGITLKPWLRRLVTRIIAVVPAAVVAGVAGDDGVSRLLNLSQARPVPLARRPHLAASHPFPCRAASSARALSWRQTAHTAAISFPHERTVNSFSFPRR